MQRPTIEKRATLTGILFVSRSGRPWEMRPSKNALDA
ncbi:hypothetical protein CIW48_05585 [Methylobacterium sp. P1-11]|nr:hypothetical protein CIW48_05585 [Methylobacterium sp. P1-11]